MSTNPDDLPDSPIPTCRGSAFENRQRALLGKILEKDPGLARMYEGALYALNQKENPERLVHAAHGIRELMEKAPRAVDIVIKSDRSLGEQVKLLCQEWKRIKPLVHEEAGRLCCEVRAKLEFVKSLEEFLERVDGNTTSRQDQAKELLRKLDPSGRQIPERLEGVHAKFWSELRDYFVGVAHHGKASEEEFIGFLSELEIFLLERLLPRTFEDMDEIDTLLGGPGKDA